MNQKKSEKKVKIKKTQEAKELSKKIKKIKEISAGRGRLVIFSSFNNTIFTITYENGEKIFMTSARIATGYSGAKKATPFAAQEAARAVLVKLNEFGISSVKVIVWVIGNGWNAAHKIICGAPDKLRIEKIESKIALPFNGCRPRKAPRK